MRNLTKRIFALATAACLSLALLPSAALAAEEPQRGTLTYSEHIAPQYEALDTFSDGLAAAKKGGKWGYINADNEVVIPFMYDRAYSFNEGKAVVGQIMASQEEEDWDYNPETDEFEVVGMVTYDYIQLGFIDQKNNLTWFTGPFGYNEDTWETEEAPVQQAYQRDKGYQMYDLLFHNGYCRVSRTEYPGGWLFDTAGKMVELGEEAGWYSPAFQVTEGMLALSAYEYGSSDLIYDMATGKAIQIQGTGFDVGEVYAELRPFNQGLAPAFRWGYDADWEYFEDGWGVVDKTGKWVIQPQYADFMLSGITTQYQVFGDTGLAMVKNFDGKWGAIDKTSKTVFPFQYDALRPFNFGLAAFAKDGKYGYLNAKGQVAIPAQYVITSGFGSNGYAAAYDGTDAFLIDTKGNRLSGTEKLNPDTYFIFHDSGVPTTFTPGEYVVIEENGKYGFGRIDYLPPLPDKSEMSGWAYAEVTAAIEENLVPTYLQNLYLNNINRDEFCDLVIQAIEEVLDQDIADVVKAQTGKELDAWQQEYPFTDSAGSNVIAAYALGIVGGRGNGLFDPYATITRQEAAAFLMRSAKVLGMDTSKADNAGFADGDSVGIWFKDAVNFVYQINVMGGTGNNSFSPLGTYTREQSYITIHRLFQAIVGQ